MKLLKAIGGVVLLLLGILWIGQGLGYIQGSAMSGQSIYAALGLLALGLGLWLLWMLHEHRPANAP